MTEPKDKVSTDNFKGFTSKNCEFYPCHNNLTRECNCLFCYCPMYFLECPGTYEEFQDAHGRTRKDCTNCIVPHNGIFQSWNIVQKYMNDPEIWTPRTK